MSGKIEPLEMFKQKVNVIKVIIKINWNVQDGLEQETCSLADQLEEWYMSCKVRETTQ